MNKKIVVFLVALMLIISLFTGCQDNLIERLEKVQAHITISVQLPEALKIKDKADPNYFDPDTFTFTLTWFPTDDKTNVNEKDFVYSENLAVVFKFDPGEYTFKLEGVTNKGTPQEEIKASGERTIALERGQRDKLEIPLTYYVYGAKSGLVVEKNGDITLSGTIEVPAGTTLKLSGNVRSEGDLIVEGNIEINGNLTVNGNLTAEKNLAVSGDLGVNGSLDAKENTTVGGAATVGSMAITENTTFGGNLTVTGPLAVADGKTFTVGGDLTLKENAEIDGSLTVNGTLFAGGDLTTKKGLSVSKDLDVAGKLDAQGTTTVTGAAVVGSMAITTNTLFGGDLTVTGPLTVADGKTLTVSGDLALEAATGIAGSLDVGGALSADDDLVVEGDLSVAGNLGVTGTLETKGTTTITGPATVGSLIVDVDTTFGNDLTVTGDLTVADGKTLTVSGDLMLKKDTEIDGSLTVNGTLSAEGDLTTKDGLSVDGDLDVGGKLDTQGSTTVTGTTTMDSLVITGNTIFVGNLTITGPLTIHDGATLTVNGDLALKKDTDIDGSLEVNGALSADDDLTVGGDLSVTGTSTVGGELAVAGSTSLKGDATVGTFIVTGDKALTGNLTVTDALVVNAGATLTIDNGGTLEVDEGALEVKNDGIITVKDGSLSVKNGGTLTVDEGTIKVEKNGTLSVEDGSLIIDNGGTLSIDEGSLDVLENGTITINDGAITIDNAGTLEVDKGTLEVKKDGTITVKDGALSIHNGGTLAVDEGTIEVKKDGTLSVDDGSLSIVNGGSISIDQGKLDVQEYGTLTVKNGVVSIDNSGTLEVDKGILEVELEGTLSVDNGSLIIDDGGSISIDEGSLDVQENGTLTVKNGTVTVDNAGTLEVDKGTLEIKKNGTVIVENAALSITNDGTLTIDEGTFEVRKDGTVTVEKGALSVKNGGTLTVDEGTVEVEKNGNLTVESNSMLAVDGGIVYINDGKFEVKENGTLAVDGGTITLRGDTDGVNINGMATLEGDSLLDLGPKGLDDVLDKKGKITLSSPEADIIENNVNIRWYILDDVANAEYTKPDAAVNLGFTSGDGTTSYITTIGGEDTIRPSELVTVKNGTTLRITEGELDLSAPNSLKVLGTVQLDGSSTLMLSESGVKNSLTSSGSIIVSSPEADIIENNVNIRWYILGEQATAVYTKPSDVNLDFSSDNSTVTIREGNIIVVPPELVTVNAGITFIIEDEKGLKTTTTNRFIVEGEVVLEPGSSLDVIDAWFKWGDETGGQVTAQAGSTVTFNNAIEYIGDTNPQWRLGEGSEAIFSQDTKKAIEFTSVTDSVVSTGNITQLNVANDSVTLSGHVKWTLDKDITLTGEPLLITGNAGLIVPKDTTFKKPLWLEDIVKEGGYIEIIGGKAYMGGATPDDTRYWFGPPLATSNNDPLKNPFFALQSNVKVTLSVDGYAFTLIDGDVTGNNIVATMNIADHTTRFVDPLHFYEGVTLEVKRKFIPSKLNIHSDATLLIGKDAILAIANTGAATLYEDAKLDILGKIGPLTWNGTHSDGTLFIDRGAVVTIKQNGSLEIKNLDVLGEVIIDGTLDLSGGWTDVDFGDEGRIVVAQDTAVLKQGTTNLRWYTLTNTKAIYSKDSSNSRKLEFEANGATPTVKPRAVNLSPTEAATYIGSGVKLLITDPANEDANKGFRVNEESQLIISDGGILDLNAYWFKTLSNNNFKGKIVIMEKGKMYWDTDRLTVGPSTIATGWHAWAWKQHGTKTIITSPNNWTFTAEKIADDNFIDISHPTVVTPIIIGSGVHAIISDELNQLNQTFTNNGLVTVTGSLEVKESGKFINNNIVEGKAYIKGYNNPVYWSGDEPVD